MLLSYKMVFDLICLHYSISIFDYFFKFDFMFLSFDRKHFKV